MTETPISTIMRIAREKRVIRPRDLAGKGIPRVYLRRLVDKGLLIRTARDIARWQESGSRAQCTQQRRSASAASHGDKDTVRQMLAVHVEKTDRTRAAAGESLAFLIGGLRQGSARGSCASR